MKIRFYFEKMKSLIINIPKFLLVSMCFLYMISYYGFAFSDLKQSKQFTKEAPVVSNNHLKLYIQAGITFNLGSIVNRTGFYINSNLVYNNIQVSCYFLGTYSCSGYGAPFSGEEYILKATFLFGYEKHQSEALPTYKLNYTNRVNSLAYSYLRYFDKRNSSQVTGIILLEFDEFIFSTENDIFAKKASDKFRTGAFKFAYSINNYQFHISSKLWTGNPRGTPKVREGNYPSRFGYRDLSESRNGKYSHGVLCIGINRQYYNSLYSAEIGIDAEKVRHFVQNKLIHDMYFIPKKWNKAKNPHYPMLQPNGEPFLFKQNQQSKKTKLFWEIQSNSIDFY